MLRDTIDFSIDMARTLKEKTLVTGQRDLIPWLDVYRGVRPVAQVWLSPSLDATGIAGAVFLAGFAMDADVVVVGLETVAWNTEINPETGARFTRDEVQELQESGRGVAMGLMTEKILIAALNRSDDMLLARIPYTRVGDTGVEFGDVDIAGRDQWQGRLPDMLLDAMRRPSAAVNPHMHQYLANVPGSEEQKRAVQDCIACDELAAAGLAEGAALMAERHENERIAIIEKYMADRSADGQGEIISIHDNNS